VEADETALEVLAAVATRKFSNRPPFVKRKTCLRGEIPLSWRQQKGLA
jgi:hypothetical protein